jgi:hypothetical protein
MTEAEEPWMETSPLRVIAIAVAVTAAVVGSIAGVIGYWVAQIPARPQTVNNYYYGAQPAPEVPKP